MNNTRSAPPLEDLGTVAPPVPRDTIFKTSQPNVADFRFNKAVAEVFDDMVDRSVPFYAEMQRMVTELAADFATPQSVVYDLGCSTGTTLVALNASLPANVKLVGIDNSPEMLERCRAKLNHAGITRPHELVCGDLHGHLDLKDASVVVLMLTLQFVRPLYRDQLVTEIARNLKPGGCLILVEKILGEDATFNRLFIKYYYEMKRRHGYSELEISQKREALENVLIPYRLEENRLMLAHAGFRTSEVFFKWHNFAGLAAIK